jgi:hypothetical protein
MDHRHSIVEPEPSHFSFSATAERRIVRATWALAWFGLFAGQLHALARHATAEGHRDLDQSLFTRLWSVPASDALSPLLDWSDPYTVYATYGKLWIPVYAAFTLCAFVVRSHREPTGAEKWGWRICLTAYALFTVSVIGDYFTPWMDQSFMFLGMPAAAMMLVGSPLLGVALLRNGFRPRITAWTLVLWLPLLLAITQVTSLGSAFLPTAFAWAYAGSRLLAERPEAITSQPATTPA